VPTPGGPGVIFSNSSTGESAACGYLSLSLKKAKTSGGGRLMNTLSSKYKSLLLFSSQQPAGEIM
jgi:hypothetical protein